jgi:RNA polymerase sigma factor (sigma-70 family)
VDAEFDRFVGSASPALLRFSYVLTSDRSDAEDLLQNALMRTLRRWPDIRGDPAAYASQVLVNLSRDRRRASRRRPVLADLGAEPWVGDGLDRLIAHDAITRAVRLLPREQREVVACRFVLDLSVQATADALGLPEGTVKSSTARALARMRELLDAEPQAASRGEAEVSDAN